MNPTTIQVSMPRSVTSAVPRMTQPLCHIPLDAAAAARSAKNINEWCAYLPTECVRMMIRMGWDYTT